MLENKGGRERWEEGEGRGREIGRGRGRGRTTSVSQLQDTSLAPKQSDWPQFLEIPTISSSAIWGSNFNILTYENYYNDCLGPSSFLDKKIFILFTFEIYIGPFPKQYQFNANYVSVSETESRFQCFNQIWVLMRLALQKSKVGLAAGQEPWQARAQLRIAEPYT